MRGHCRIDLFSLPFVTKNCIYLFLYKVLINLEKGVCSGSIKTSLNVCLALKNTTFSVNQKWSLTLKNKMWLNFTCFLNSKREVGVCAEISVSVCIDISECV